MATLTAPAETTADEDAQSAPSMWARPAVKIGGCVVVLLAAIVASWFLATSTATAPTADSLPGPAAPGAPAAPQVSGDGHRLTDAKAGYQLTYPTAWAEVTDAAGIAGGSDGHVIRISGKNAFSIRTFPLEHAVSSDNLQDMRAVTDAILSNPDAKLTVLDVRHVTVAEKPTVYYLYYFGDGAERGIHAHYFVFDGKKMHALVFQVVPADDFDRYAAQFDAVLASFKPLAH